MITKDGRDTPIDKLTPENYIVPKGEEKDYHAIIEVVLYDQKTGRKLSKPRIQKFGRKSFESHIEASLRKQGYTITILHDPTEWLKEQKAKAAQTAKAKAQAEKERFDAAVAAAVAKALADREQAENKPKRGKKAEQEQETE